MSKSFVELVGELGLSILYGMFRFAVTGFFWAVLAHIFLKSMGWFGWEIMLK